MRQGRQGLVVLLLVTVGCGSAGATRADVWTRAEERCAAADAALERVPWPEDPEATLRGTAPAVAQTAFVHQALVDELAALSTSGDAQLDDVVAAARPLPEALRRMSAAAEAGDDAAFDVALDEVTAQGEAAAAAAARLGLDCYQPEGTA
jgi:hypothetical protein